MAGVVESVFRIELVGHDGVSMWWCKPTPVGIKVEKEIWMTAFRGSALTYTKSECEDIEKFIDSLERVAVSKIRYHEAGK